MNIDNSSFITDVKNAIDYYKRYDKLITSILIRKDKHDLMLIETGCKNTLLILK